MMPAEGPRRVRLLTAAILLGTFGAGALSGLGALRWLGPRAQEAAPPSIPGMVLPRELRLDPAQDAKAREIGERYRPELEALATEIRPRVRAVQARMEAELLAVLTPDQRRQLTQIQARRSHPPRPAAPPPPGSPAGEEPPRPPPSGGRRPPPPEAVEACAHLDLDALCRFTHDGRELEGSCRRAPDGQGDVSCAPDRALYPPPPEEHPR
jgi:hypothetical protein